MDTKDSRYASRNLKEVVKAINDYDKAMAATSYSQNLYNYVLPLLSNKSQKKVAALVWKLALEDRAEAKKSLEEFGFDVTLKEQPSDYRLKFNETSQ